MVIKYVITGTIHCIIYCTIISPRWRETIPEVALEAGQRHVKLGKEHYLYNVSKKHTQQLLSAKKPGFIV